VCGPAKGVATFTPGNREATAKFPYGIQHIPAFVFLQPNFEDRSLYFPYILIKNACFLCLINYVKRFFFVVNRVGGLAVPKLSFDVKDHSSIGFTITAQNVHILRTEHLFEYKKHENKFLRMKFLK